MYCSWNPLNRRQSTFHPCHINQQLQYAKKTNALPDWRPASSHYTRWLQKSVHRKHLQIWRTFFFGEDSCFLGHGSWRLICIILINLNGRILRFTHSGCCADCSMADMPSVSNWCRIALEPRRRVGLQPSFYLSNGLVPYVLPGKYLRYFHTIDTIVFTILSAILRAKYPSPEHRY